MVICDRCGTGKQYERIRAVEIWIKGDDQFDSSDRHFIKGDYCTGCKDIIKEAAIKGSQLGPQPTPPRKFTDEEVKELITDAWEKQGIPADLETFLKGLTNDLF